MHPLDVEWLADQLEFFAKEIRKDPTNTDGTLKLYALSDTPGRRRVMFEVEINYPYVLGKRVVKPDEA